MADIKARQQSSNKTRVTLSQAVNSQRSGGSSSPALSQSIPNPLAPTSDIESSALPPISENVPKDPVPFNFALESCSCGAKTVNKACILKKCKKCCIKCPERCMVFEHNKGKGESALTNSLVATIDDAITNNTLLHMIYSGKFEWIIESI